MALLDDIGGNSAPSKAAPQTSSLLQDLGDTSGGGTDLDYHGPSDAPPNMHSVTDEGISTAKDIVKAIPRQLATGASRVLDQLGSGTMGGGIPAMTPAAQDVENTRQDDIRNHPVVQAAANEIADRLGLPKTNKSNPLASVVGAGVEALPTGLLGGPEALLPTAASAMASETAKQAGGGPGMQFLAGLTPLAPAAGAASIRGAVRGGSGAAMEENLANAKNANIQISPGQAAENPILQTAETTSAKIPGGGPLRDTRAAGINQQAEESISNIVKKLAPDLNQKPPTPTMGGELVETGIKNRVQKLNEETTEAKNGMEQAVGGKDTPMAAPKLEAALAKVTSGTGVESIDNLVTGAKTKAIAKAVDSVSNQPRVPTSYSTDGEGAHVVTSPNGETHAVETATGDLKVTRSDTSPAAQGQGEGTSRLETLAHTATAKGKNLVSDVSVSPAEAASYEKLGRRGWDVQKNPNAEVNPDTGNTISDSPKNPVYTVKAPNTQGTGEAVNTTGSSEKQLTGEWTYNPKTGKSEPVTTSPATGGPAPEAQTAVLNQATPHTFDSLRQLRTLIGRGIKSTRDPGQQGQLKQLYAAISGDLEDGVKAKGPEAESAYGFFNSVAKQNAGTQKILTKAVKDLGGPEATFKAAMSGTKDGATKISPIMQSLDPEGQNFFRATVLHRLGRAGGAVDAPFDANTLLTNWKGMSPEAKNVLFNTKEGWGAPGNLRSSLDSLSSTLDLLKGQGYIKSGMAKAVQQGTAGLTHGTVGAAIALIGETAVSAGYHFAAGNPMAAAGAVGATAGVLTANPILSRVLTNPKTAAWLAQATKAPKGAIPILMNQLNQMGNKDPDAKDLAGLIAQEGNK